MNIILQIFTINTLKCLINIEMEMIMKMRKNGELNYIRNYQLRGDYI